MFLHGFMGTKSDWEQVVSNLASSFYCIGVDLPGHGKSVSLPDSLYTFDGLAVALCAIIEELDPGLVTMVGYSMGGRIGLYTVLTYPEWFKGIVLESAHPGITEEMERQQRLRIDKNRADRLERSSFYAFLKEWYHMPLFASLGQHTGLQNWLIEDRLQHNNPRELAMALRGLGTGIQPSMWDRISDANMDVFFLTGAYDKRYKQIGEQLKLRIPSLGLEVIPNAGHNVHLEQTHDYVSKLKQLLNKLYD